MTEQLTLNHKNFSPTKVEHIIPLSEGSFTVDKTKTFIPFNQQQDVLQNRPVGSMLVEVQPFVIITSRDVILLDTGLGFSINGKLQLLHQLQQHHIEPQQITKVLLTHLHKDHASGIICKNEHIGKYETTFPNATYYIQEYEYKNALLTNSPSFSLQQLLHLKNLPNIAWLNKSEGSIDGYIWYKLTAAHSQYHQVFWIYTENKIIFYGGDDAPQYQQIKNKLIAKYDYNGRLAMELRQQWRVQGEKEHWTFLFYHDTKTPIFKL